MKYIKNLPLLLLVFLCGASSLNLNATHIVGADMTFVCNAKEWFEINLTVRRDCINGDEEAVFDDPAYVGIFDSYGTPLNWLGSLGAVRMELVSTTEILPNEDECAEGISTICVSEARYVGQVFLPYREDGYILGYQRCCRNVTLNNISNPLETGNTSFVCITGESLTSCNSSPEFGEWPDLYICQDEELSFNSAATDRDGDRLEYMLYTPHAGASLATPQPIPPSGPPYDTVEYAPGFSLDNMLGSGVPLTIDRNTGVLTATPGAVGQYLVGVLVTEFRGDQVLSKTRRNFEYNVRSCNNGPTISYEAPSINCEGRTITFNNTSTDVNGSFAWNFNYPNNDPAFTSTDVSPTFTFPANGEYQVQLVRTDGVETCNDEFIRTIRVSDQGNGSVNFDTPSLACSGLTVSFVNSSDPNGSYMWNFNSGVTGSNLMSSDFSPTFTFPSAGTYDVTLTRKDGVSGCSNEITRTIEVNADGALVSFNAPDIQCNGLKVDFENTSDASGEYMWNFNYPANDPSAMSTEFSPSYTFPAAGTYQVQLTRKDGTADCTPELIRTITVNETGFGVGFNAPSLQCTGLEVGFENTSDPSGEYMWNFNYPSTDPATMSSDYSPRYRFPAEGSYQVQLVRKDEVNSVGCKFELIQTVEVYENTLTAGFDFTIDTCIGSQRRLVVTSTAEETSPDRTIRSQTYEIVVDNVLFSRERTANFEINVPCTGRIVVRQFIESSNECPATAEEVVLDDDGGERPTIEFFANPAIICPGESIRLVANPNPDWTYTWSPTDGLSFPNGPSDPLFAPEVTTTYTVTVSNGSQSVTEMITVEVRDESLEVGINDDTAPCALDASLMGFALNAGRTDVSYEWSFDPDFGTIVAVGENVSIPLTDMSMTIYMRASGEGFCDSNIASLNLPPAGLVTSAAFDPINTCISTDGSVTVTNNNPDDPITVVWNASDNITSDLNLPTVDIVALEGQTSIPLIYTAISAEGCTDTDTIEVPVVMEFDLTISGDAASCDSSSTYTASSLQDLMDATFEWSLDPDFNEIIGTGESVDVSLPEGGTLYLRGTSVNGCASEVTSLDIRNGALELTSDQNLNQQICVGDSSLIDLGASADGLLITWTDQDGNELGTGDSITVDPRTVTSVTGTATEGSCSGSITFTISEYQFDLTIDGLDDPVCTSDPIDVTVTDNTGSNISYLWLSENGGVLSGDSTATPTIDPLNADDLILVATNNDLGCIMEFPLPVVTNGSISATINANPGTTINSGESVDLDVDTDAEGPTFLWDDGNTNGSRTVMPEETTTYRVTVTDVNGCTAEAEITITVEDPVCANFGLPTAFSPNGDNVNNILLVRSDGPLDNFDFQIIDRWGKEVYRSTDPSEGWNGRFRQDGKELPPDVYAYCLKVTCNGEENILSGNVSLIR